MGPLRTCAAGGTAGDNKDDLAFFSSKGPTRDNRIKPDVVAPGTWIASAKTHGETVVWQDDLENTIPGAWSNTAGFQFRANWPGALSGTHVWRLNRAKGTFFQDILITPSVALPVGHDLTFEVWLRGNVKGLDRLQLGLRSGPDSVVFKDRNLRTFAGWRIVSTRIPKQIRDSTGNPKTIYGTNVQFLLVAQEAGGLGADIDLAVDNFKVTTFSSWDALSTLHLAAPNDARDHDYTLEGGTSMSAPLAAGCATLVRQTLTSAGTENPSAELVKAILINSADPFRGPRPNFQAGWGLINLRRAIVENFDFDFESTLTSGQEMNYNVAVPAGAPRAARDDRLGGSAESHPPARPRPQGHVSGRRRDAGEGPRQQSTRSDQQCGRYRHAESAGRQLDGDGHGSLCPRWGGPTIRRRDLDVEVKN